VTKRFAKSTTFEGAVADQVRESLARTMVERLEVVQWIRAHGRERYTKDLDVFVKPTKANARGLGRVLAESGFRATARKWAQFVEPYRILTLGREPVRIAVLTSISGVSFDAAWKGRAMITTDVGKIPIIGLTELRVNKAASGRTIDRLDLALLDELALANKPIRARGRSRSTRRKPAARRSRTRGTAKRRG
jgi:hypothetical protein